MNKFFDIKRKKISKKHFIFLHDTLISLLSFPLSLWLRVGNEVFSYPKELIFKHTLVYTFLSAGIFLWFRTYKNIWRYFSLNELIFLVIAVGCTNILYLICTFMMVPSNSVPYSLFIINWFTNVTLLGGARITYRFLKSELKSPSQNDSPSSYEKILLIGLTDQTEIFIRDQRRSKRKSYEIIGIIETRNRHSGGRVHSIDILGHLKEFPQVLKKLQAVNQYPQKIIITDPDFTGKPLQEFIKNHKKYNIEIARLSHLWEMTSSTQKIEVKPLSIEDLLGRPQVELDRDSMARFLHNKRVLITGCGGSIGGELTRQIAKFGPSHITLLDHSEYLLYKCDLELSEDYPEIPRKSFLADVSNSHRISEIFHREKPQIIFHAAALKHVPIAQMNPNEAVLTNVIGTQNVAEAARQYKVKAVVFISTDKAVNPTSIMGTTKRLAESYCQALDAVSVKEKSTRFITTRFGNVLGSTGSVVPLFKRQINRGGPLTVTHPEVRRYFMTTHEAVELVLQAAVLGYEGVETAGQIFVLEMGSLIKISDLAKQMIQFAGFIPDKDIKITYTGLREGEKLYEELFYGEEKLIETKCKGLMLISSKLINYQYLKNALYQLKEYAQHYDTNATLSLLKELVPEYKNNESTILPSSEKQIGLKE
jgi:FlaA1/EpsC-like NDP-sugar epimerase